MFDKQLNATRIIVTKHAKERALARARLVLYAHEKEDIDAFIRKDFMNAREDRKVVMTPFYKNKGCSKYGSESFVMCSNIMKYMGRYHEKENVVVITTVAYLKN